MLTELLTTPIAEVLGQVLLHALWQGAVIALSAALLFRGLHVSPPTLHYRVGCAGLALMVALPVLTFIYLLPGTAPTYRFVEPAKTGPPVTTEVQQLEPTDVLTAEPAPSSAPFTHRPALSTPRQTDILPYLVLAWVVGVVLLSVRLVCGFIVSRGLTKRTRAVPANLQQRFKALTEHMGITRRVELLESRTAPVPLVLGWLKPVVLLPTSALAGLTVEQLELILAHELAHASRNDYLVNLLQSVAETLLFYHPAVWWLSNRIREEREHCCDDQVVALYGDKLAYARTLAQLDALTPPTPQIHSTQTALAATGGTLLKRIKRLAGHPNYGTPVNWLIGISLLLVPALLFSVASAQARFPVQIEENIDAFVTERLETWNAPGMQVAVIQAGEVTFNKGYGLANLEIGTAMTADTPIPLGSAAWLPNLIAAFTLVESGSLDLDSTLAEVLPWLEFNSGEEAAITVRDLILGNANVLDTVWLPEGHSELPGENNNPVDIADKETFIRSLMPDQLRTNFGARLHPNYNYIVKDVLIGLVLEAASGMPQEELLAQAVFTPLDIEAQYSTNQSQPPAQTLTYVSTNGTLIPQKMVPAAAISPAELSSALGLSLSSRDLAKLLTASSSRADLLTASSWEQLFSRQGTDWSVGAWNERLINNNAIYAIIGGAQGSEIFIEIIPETETAYLTMTNYSLPHNKHPLYQVLGSVSMALFILNEDAPFSKLEYDTETLDDLGIFAEHLTGTYASALGVLELHTEGDVLSGTILGHDLVLKRAATPGYLIQTEFAALDGVQVNIVSDTFTILGRQFAFRKVDR